VKFELFPLQLERTAGLLNRTYAQFAAFAIQRFRQPLNGLRCGLVGSKAMRARREQSHSAWIKHLGISGVCNYHMSSLAPIYLLGAPAVECVSRTLRLAHRFACAIAMRIALPSSYPSANKAFAISTALARTIGARFTIECGK
jgi:hypothetical protein